MNRSLADRVASAPRLSNPSAARKNLDALVAAPEAKGLAALLAAGKTRDLLLGLADHSPYLWTLATEDPARLVRLIARPPMKALEAIVAALDARRDDSEAELMRALRQSKALGGLPSTDSLCATSWGVRRCEPPAEAAWPPCPKWESLVQWLDFTFCMSPSRLTADPTSRPWGSTQTA